MPKDELKKKTAEVLELVGLGGMGKKRATELSGGQEQRVSLARALIVEPKILLLDEPLSALDASLRESMQTYIRHLNEQTGVTMLMVTHDQREAVAVSDRIALIKDGELIQIGKPQDFYTHPKTKYVAEFFGWKNFVLASGDSQIARLLRDRMSADGGARTEGAGVAAGAGGAADVAHAAGGTAGAGAGDAGGTAGAGAGDAGDAQGTAEGAGVENTGSAGGAKGGESVEASFSIRPEAATLAEGGPLRATVKEARYQGATTLITAECDGDELVLELPSSANLTFGSEFSFDLDPASCCLLA